MDKYINQLEIEQIGQLDKKLSQNSQGNQQNEGENSQPFSSQIAPSEGENRGGIPNLQPEKQNSNVYENNSSKIQSDFDENDDLDDSDSLSTLSSKVENNQKDSLSESSLKNGRRNSLENQEQSGQVGRRNRSFDKNNNIFLEWNNIYYKANLQNAEEIDLKQQYNIYEDLKQGQRYNSDVVIKLVNQQYQDQFTCMTKDGCSYMNADCTKIIKVFEENSGHNKQTVRINLVKILQSLEGGYEDLIQYFSIASLTRYLSSAGEKEASFYILEFEIGLNTLFNVLKLLKDKQINLQLMQSLFQGFVDNLLQMHARFEIMNQFGLHSIYLHSKNIYFIDFFDESKTFENPKSDLNYVQEGDNLVSNKDQVDYFKKDIYNIAKCLISIEMIKEGYSFFHVLELFQKDKVDDHVNDYNKQEGNKNQPQFNFLLYATKHNCNQYFLKTKKFIAIEENQIIMYEVKNIIEEMLQEDPSKRLSSVKLAMICQKSNLLMRDIMYPYINEFPPTFQLDQDNNTKILNYPFKPIQQTQDIENHATITKNGEKIFEGTVDILRKPVDICEAQIFQFYVFKGFFIQGFPYMKAQLKCQNNTIIEGDCFNFIFKQWLIKSKILQEVKIMNLFQISSWINRNKSQIELPNIIIAGDNKKIVKLNSNFVMDIKIFEQVNQIISNIELINMNNIDVKLIQNSQDIIEKLKNVKYLTLALDTEEKIVFLIKYLNSQFCQNLEVLDISNSTKLDYKDYELNKTINNANGYFTKLNTIILTNCKSSAPNSFLGILINCESFRKIQTLVLDDTYVDQGIFSKFFESPYLSTLKNLSLNEVAGINDQSVVQLSERISKFKNIVKLNLSGMLKKNFNKNLFTDSNISAFKKLASCMSYLIFLEKLVLDDSYLNDSVLESMAKSNMPSLEKIYLRRQQKVTYKGINYLLQTQNFRNLKLINCNSSSSVTLPKNIISHIEVSVMGCKSVNSTNVSEFLKSNPSAQSIRFDAKNIASDVITAINLSKYLKRITLYCSDSTEISKIILLLKNIDNIKKIQFVINFHLSKSFIIESDNEFLGQNQYKRTKPNNGTVQQTIDDFRSEIYKCMESKFIKEQILENLIIHNQLFASFYNDQNFIEQVDISSFISLSISTDDYKENLIQAEKNSNQEPENKKKQQVEPSILPSSQSSQQKLIDTIQAVSGQDQSENHLNNELKKKFYNQQNTLCKMQYLEDLKNFLQNSNLIKNQQSINLTPFQIGPDEINFITFSANLSSVQSLILQNSMLRSQDLKLLSHSALSLNNLTHIDLSNNKLPIINGLISLLQTEALPKLSSIKLGQFKIKILLKNVTQYFRRVSVPLTYIQNFPKFNVDNKIKVMIQNNVSNKKYLETLDFYVKKGDFVNASNNQFGYLKILMCPYISFYIKNCQKYPEQTHNLHRLMRFWRIKEMSNQIQGQSVVEQKVDQLKLKQNSHLTLTVIGHELAGKKSIVESFLQNNLNDGQELVDIKKNHNKNQSSSLNSFNMGMKYFLTEFQSEQTKINLTMKVMHSNPLFNQLRLNHLRDCDGICIIYDTSRKDIGSEMMQYLYEVHLFKYQKPVYVVANNFKNKKSANIFDLQNLIPDIKYTDVSLSNLQSIKNFFNQISKDALITKMKKPVFSSNLLRELSEELTHLHLDEFELKFDFLKVRNKVDIDSLKQFCQEQKENETINKMEFLIYNWGNYGKSTEELLNKLGDQKINVQIKNSIQAYINV
ncbi:hypothetical protein TTHERM_00446040 (macronuclear) [Tetrahymena thermophila SB210]|uniref:Protein kinase domain-containing protein n=1 Tax=Tetrahymena thermophila (strain SB210) TaxID=312017 RepID=I7M3G8_TETTS|nr:hypothetical protein TTHERM_00446040 [Tetrahymena thermophila SB210]EAS03123.2 hypothetical protein TTHERM_00446040 [Tetrahymena thermophila SB210]|eukprot:XP_001023368.2 hypothetical protein TTHERM_00446040 [Tetrahymena thermophila SB210]